MEEKAIASRPRDLGPNEVYRRVIKGFGAQGAQLLIRTAQQIIFVPVLIGTWGQSVYEDWVVMFAAMGLVAILELGTQTYFGNQLLAHWAAGDKTGFNRIIGNAMGVYIIVTLVSAGLFVISFSLINWPLMVSTDALAPVSASLILFFLALGNVILIPLGMINSIYRARGEFIRFVNFGTLLLIIQILGQLGTLFVFKSPVAFAIAYAASTCLGCFILIADQKHRYPDIVYRISIPSVLELRELSSKAPLYLLNSAATSLIMHGPIIILDALSPLGGAAAAFATSRVLIGVLRQLIHQMAHSSGVEMAYQYAKNDVVALQSLYLHTGKMIGVVFGLFAGPLIIILEPFFRLWTRGEIIFDHWLFWILLGTVFLALPGQVAMMMFYYTNRPRPVAVAGGLHALLGLILCTSLSGRFGAVGAAVSMGVAEVVMYALYLPIASQASSRTSLLAFLTRTYGIALVSLAVSYITARLVAAVITLNDYVGLVMFGAVWSLMAIVPALLLLPNPLQASLRRWLWASHS